MEHIINAIISYIKRGNTNYAVMLTGEWGSGKTYFWENTLKQKIEQIQHNSTSKNYKTIYISLYGVQTVEEIAKKIFLNKFVQLNDFTKKHSKITELGKLAWSMVKEVNVQGVKIANAKKVNFDELLNFKDIVICFDDLERSKIEISTVMGYISNFVEHDQAKVIILCNEKEIQNESDRKNQELKILTAAYLSEKSTSNIDSSNRNSKNFNDSKNYKSILSAISEDYFGNLDVYKKYKEKLVGLTLLYNPQNEEQLLNLVKSLKNEDVKFFLRNKVLEINNIILNSSSSNLRIMQRAFFDFEAIYEYIKSYDSRLFNTELMDEILISLIVISLEIKTGKEEFDFLKTINPFFPIDMAKHQAPNNSQAYEKYIKSFLERYFDTGNKNKFKYFKFIDSIVRMGYR